MRKKFGYICLHAKNNGKILDMPGVRLGGMDNAQYLLRVLVFAGLLSESG